MRTKFFALLLVALSVAACKNDERDNPTQNWSAIGALKISTNHPKPGDAIKLRYPDPEKDAADDFSAYYYILIGDKTYAYDLDMTLKDSLWEGEINLPDSANAVAFNFKIGEDYITRDKQGYAQPLYDQDQNILPGSLACIAYFHYRYDADFGLQTNKDSLIDRMGKDIEEHP